MESDHSNYGAPISSYAAIKCSYAERCREHACTEVFCTKSARRCHGGFGPVHGGVTEVSGRCTEVARRFSALHGGCTEVSGPCTEVSRRFRAWDLRARRSRAHITPNSVSRAPKPEPPALESVPRAPKNVSWAPESVSLVLIWLAIGFI